MITGITILTAGELIARFFVKPNPIPLPPAVSTIDPYKNNPYIMWIRPFLHSHIPGSRYFQSRSYYNVTYYINSAGFRGPEIAPKEKGHKRLAIIGDSIVEGHGCEFKDTFSFKLNKKAKPYNWDVVNLGVQGASPSFFALNLERYLSCQPDAVMIVLFENDLYDDRIQEKNYFTKPIMDEPERLFFGYMGKKTSLKDSRLYLLLERSYHKTFPNPIETIIIKNKKENIVNQEQKTLDKLSCWLVAPSMFEKQWNMSRAYLDYTLKELEKRKLPVFFVFLSLGGLAPDLNKAYSDYITSLHSHISAWTTANKLHFISLVPVIKKILSERPVNEIMIHDDGHPTPAAHEIICDEIWKKLMGTQGKSE